MKEPKKLLVVGAVVAVAVTMTVFLSSTTDEQESYHRRLQEFGDLPMVQGFGGNPDTSVFPLQLCSGDCDVDSDCDVGLICYQRSANMPVPGCQGGENFAANSDFCIVDPAFTTPAPTITTAPSEAPTISAQPSISSAPTRDEIAVEFVGSDGNPADVFPLQRCQADCDRDRECSWGLYCHTRSDAFDPVPGCFYDPSVNWIGSADVCVDLPSLLPDAFRLKLYWEEGYVWQESTQESFWCATTNFNGYPGTGNCWYGNVTQPCDADKLYLARCSGTGLTPEQQAFRFIPVVRDYNSTGVAISRTHGSTFRDQEEEILIQSADVTDQRCWERYKREVFLAECNASNPLQRWWASNGTDFFSNENRFEISQVGFTRQCVSNDHHPKPGEVVELHSCEALRSPKSQTAYWSRY